MKTLIILLILLLFVVIVITHMGCCESGQTGGWGECADGHFRVRSWQHWVVTAVSHCPPLRVVCFHHWLFYSMTRTELAKSRPSEKTSPASVKVIVCEHLEDGYNRPYSQLKFRIVRVFV